MGDNDKPMMACGHAANAYDDKGAQCCVICIGLTPKASEVVPTPDLSTRKARCCYHHEGTGLGVPSRTTLDLSLSREIVPGWRLGVKVDNATGSDTPEVLGYTAPPRSVMMSLQGRWR